MAPLASRFSIVLASAIFIISQSLLQAAVIVTAAAFLGAGLPDVAGLSAIALIVFHLALSQAGLRHYQGSNANSSHGEKNEFGKR